MQWYEKQERLFKKFLGGARARSLNIGGFFYFTPEQANNLIENELV